MVVKHLEGVDRSRHSSPDASRLLRRLSACIPVALGRPRRDLDGLRQSPLETTRVQQMMARLGSYMDAQLVSMLSADIGRADEFIAATLGQLAETSPSSRTRLRTRPPEQVPAGASPRQTRSIGGRRAGGVRVATPDGRRERKPPESAAHPAPSNPTPTHRIRESMVIRTQRIPDDETP